MKSLIPLIILAMGMLMLVGSAVWPMLFPPTNSWTDEKSRQLSEAAAHASSLSYAVNFAKRKPSMTSGENPAIVQEKYVAAMAELNRMRDEFRSATESPKNISSFLKWGGILVVGVGLISWFAQKS